MTNEGTFTNLNFTDTQDEVNEKIFNILVIESDESFYYQIEKAIYSMGARANTLWLKSMDSIYTKEDLYQMIEGFNVSMIIFDPLDKNSEFSYRMHSLVKEVEEDWNRRKGYGLEFIRLNRKSRRSIQNTFFKFEKFMNFYQDMPA